MHLKAIDLDIGHSRMERYGRKRAGIRGHGSRERGAQVNMITCGWSSICRRWRSQRWRRSAEGPTDDVANRADPSKESVHSTEANLGGLTGPAQLSVSFALPTSVLFAVEHHAPTDVQTWYKTSTNSSRRDKRSVRCAQHAYCVEVLLIRSG